MRDSEALPVFELTNEPSDTSIRTANTGPELTKLFDGRTFDARAR